MDFGIITASFKKGLDVLMANIVAYVIAFIIVAIGSCFIVTIGPLVYGFYYMVLKGARGETPEFKDVLYGFSSAGMFIRSWIGVLGMALPIIALVLVLVVINMLLVVVLKSVGAIIGVLLGLVGAILALVLMIFLYFTLFIYVMTPSENIVYALKESFRIGKANIIMTLLTVIIAGICGIIPFVGSALGSLFAVNMLKEFEPSLKDQS